MKKIPALIFMLSFISIVCGAEKIDWKTDFSAKSDKMLTWKSAKAKVKMTKDFADKERKQPAMIMVFDENTKNVNALAGKFFPIERNKKLTAVVTVKCTGFKDDGRVSVSMQGWKEKKSQIPAANTSSGKKISECTEDKEIALTFTVPEKGAWAKADWIYLTISAKAKGPGTVIFKDLEFYEE